jgi:hypothetical protein
VDLNHRPQGYRMETGFGGWVPDSV